MERSRQERFPHERGSHEESARELPALELRSRARDELALEVRCGHPEEAPPAQRLGLQLLARQLLARRSVDLSRLRAILRRPLRALVPVALMLGLAIALGEGARAYVVPALAGGTHDGLGTDGAWRLAQAMVRLERATAANGRAPRDATAAAEVIGATLTLDGALVLSPELPPLRYGSHGSEFELASADGELVVEGAPGSVRYR